MHNCHQYVYINNIDSGLLVVMHGVPQGFILGPSFLLFTAVISPKY